MSASPCVDHGQGAKRYGFTSANGRTVLIHRAIYAREHGLDVLTLGGVVRHTCDNPRCINPRHLLLGTQSDNIQDMLLKQRGRPRRGVESPAAKLTEADIKFIRAYDGKQADLVAKFGVSQAQISRIQGGHRWAHLP